MLNLSIFSFFGFNITCSSNCWKSIPISSLDLASTSVSISSALGTTFRGDFTLPWWLAAVQIYDFQLQLDLHCSTTIFLLITSGFLTPFSAHKPQQLPLSSRISSLPLPALLPASQFTLCSAGIMHAIWYMSFLP